MSDDEGGAPKEGQTEAERLADLKKKRQFRKFAYRGLELEALLDLTLDELVALYPCRARRRLSRGLKRKPKALITRLLKAKKEATPGERPRGIKTHLRDMIITPEMLGSVVGALRARSGAPSRGPRSDARSGGTDAPRQASTTAR